jgi:hypothetical protein
MGALACGGGESFGIFYRWKGRERRRIGVCSRFLRSLEIDDF